MRLVVAAVGRPRDPRLADAIREYETRAARYWPLRVQHVREEPARSAPPELVRRKEGERLLGAIDARARVVACEPDGAQMSSEEFSAWLVSERERAAGDVAFLIGGAFGLAPLVRERASTRLAFSRWTLPHELARLVLAEQLYRAGTIARGEPYHK